jgi:hypothetical protein
VRDVGPSHLRGRGSHDHYHIEYYPLLNISNFHSLLGHSHGTCLFIYIIGPFPRPNGDSQYVDFSLLIGPFPWDLCLR